MEKVAPTELRRPEVMRWLVVTAVIVMLVISFSIGVRSVASPIAAVINLIAALAVGWFGWSMATAKASKVVFDGERLTDNAGVELCTIDEIENVERGFAMFKPSAGFAILLREEKPRGWSPGLWWRNGRRIGVGGATPGRAARNMADAITMALALKQIEAEQDGKKPKLRSGKGRR